MTRLVVRIALMMGAVWLTFRIVSGLSFEGDFWALLITALLLGVANGVVIPVIKFFAIPLRIVTLGLATLVINLVILFLLLALAESMGLGMTSEGFASNLLGALILTVLSSVISFLTKD